MAVTEGCDVTTGTGCLDGVDTIADIAVSSIFVYNEKINVVIFQI